MPAVFRSSRRSEDVSGRDGIGSGKEMMGKTPAGVRVMWERKRRGILVLVSCSEWYQVFDHV